MGALRINGRPAIAADLIDLEGPVLFVKSGDELNVTQITEATMRHSHLRMVWGAFALLALTFVLLPAALASSAVVFMSKDPQGKPMALWLFQEPCGEKVAQHLKAEYRDRFRASKLTWGGKDYESCWIVQGGTVHSIDEAGDLMTPIPIHLFRNDAS